MNENLLFYSQSLQDNTAVITPSQNERETATRDRSGERKDPDRVDLKRSSSDIRRSDKGGGGGEDSEDEDEVRCDIYNVYCCEMYTVVLKCFTLDCVVHNKQKQILLL